MPYVMVLTPDSGLKGLDPHHTVYVDPNNSWAGDIVGLNTLRITPLK